MNIHLVIFHTKVAYGKEGYYDESVNRLVNTFKENGGNEVHIYTEDNIPFGNDDIKNWFEQHKSQAFGFYAFKPLVILDVMSKISEGDVIIYHDAGRPEYNFSFKKPLQPLIDSVVKNHQGIGLGEGGWLHNQYTKDKCFKLMDCDNEDIRGKNMMVATWGVFEKNLKALSFLIDWRKWCLNHDVICTSVNEQNHEGFVRHTWDQSILTNLFHLYSLQKLPNVNKGWEKDINSFIDNDYSLIKVPNVLTTSENITTVLDVYYKNDKLFILVTGAVEDVFLVNDENLISRDEKTNDPHVNVHLFTFNIEYRENIKIKLTGFNQSFDNPYAQFSVTKNYYEDCPNEHIITVICNGFRNSIDSIVTFVKYHINLGVDKIALHYREGNNIKEIYDVLRNYIESKKVILIDWKGKVAFYQIIRKDGFHTGLGEVAHMNHTLNIFKEGKYLTWLNLDQLLVPPKEILNVNSYLDYLSINYSCVNSGGFILELTNFKKPNTDLKYYESKEVINNISPYPQLTYFIQNVKVITSHYVTSGPSPIKLPKEALAVNHYPFLDNSRKMDETVIEYLDNLNKDLIIQ
jgi:hypothetical protein